METSGNTWIINQGATNPYEFSWVAGGATVDLTGCMARLQVRTDYADKNGALLLELSTENGRLTLTPLTGKIAVLLLPADTVEARWGRGVWDLEITHPNGWVTRLLQGTAILSKEVTR